MWLIALTIAAEPAAVERVRTVEYTREDGLRVVVLHQPSARTASVVTVIEGGMVDEPREGLAHKLADAWFASLPDGERTVQDLYALIGAEAGVEIEPDATVFWAHGSLASLPGMLEFERLRFSAPLRGLTELAQPSGPTSRRSFSARYLEPVYSTVYPASHPYYGIWRVPDSNLLLHDLDAQAKRTWVPSRATTLIAAPNDPGEVLCMAAPSSCGSVVKLEQLEAELKLPDPTLDTPPPPLPPRFRDVGPLDAGIPDPLILLAWALPGTDSGAAGALELATDLVEASLRDERRPPDLSLAPYCFLYEGRLGSTFVCVLRADPRTDLRKWRRKLRKGWKIEKIEARTQRWRNRMLGRVMGTSEDPTWFSAVALDRHRGSEASVHGGALSRLGFGPDDVKNLLENHLSESQMVVIRLVAQ